MKTMSQLAQDALNVQDACNLSGVVHGFSRAITDLRALIPKASTDEINKHPICLLWADKIAHLTGTQVHATDSLAFSRAYQWVDAASRGEVK
jgi:hypothetical protein